MFDPNPPKTEDKYCRYQVYVYIIVYLDLQSCGEFQADDLSLLEELHGFTLPGMASFQLACSKHGSLCMRRRVVNHRVKSELLLTAPNCIKEKKSGKKFKTPPKTNMTMWKITIFNREYIFKWLILHCHVSFLGCKFSESLIPQPAYIH